MGQQHGKTPLKLESSRNFESDEKQETLLSQFSSHCDAAKQLCSAVKEQDLDKMDSLLQTAGKDSSIANSDEHQRNALHYACIHEPKSGEKTVVTKLLSRLLKNDHLKSKIDATDKWQNTPLHCAIKHNNSCAALELLDVEANFKMEAVYENKDNNTAFHGACLVGLLDVVKKMLELAKAEKPGPLEWKGHKGATPLHAACRNSHLDIVKELIEKNADVTLKDNKGNTPLHAAVSGVKVEETFETAMFLLEKNEKLLEKKNNIGQTPIAIACRYGHSKVVDLLLKKGATVDSKCMFYALEGKFSFTVRSLVQCQQWCDALRLCSDGVPVFNWIISIMPEIAANVLDNCTVKQAHTRINEAAIAFNYEFLEPFDEESKHSRSTHRVVDSDGGSDEIDYNPMHHAKMDIAKKEKEFEDVRKQSTDHFLVKWGLKDFRKSQHPLGAIIKSGNYHLLTHPVVRSLLDHKWMSFGLKLYLISLMLFLPFILSFTAFSLVAPTPYSGLQCSSPENRTCNIPEDRRWSIYLFATLTILSALLQLLLKLAKVIAACKQLHSIRHYLTTVRIQFNWLDVPCYVFAIIFATVIFNDCLCPLTWQWQVGIFALFIAWLTFLRFINKLPIVGIYILMFKKITITFGKVAMSLGIPLIFAFAWPFYLALHDPEVLRSPFQNPGIAIVKVLSMTFGNFDYDDTFRRDPSGESDSQEELPFLPVVYILWISFIVLMPVLLNNLLIGLAIGDISDIQKQAELEELVHKVELVLEYEQLLPRHLRCKWRPGCKIVYPWKPKTENGEKCYCFSSYLRKIFVKERESYESPKAVTKVFMRKNTLGSSQFQDQGNQQGTADNYEQDLMKVKKQIGDIERTQKDMKVLLVRMAEHLKVPVAEREVWM